MDFFSKFLNCLFPYHTTASTFILYTQGKNIRAPQLHKGLYLANTLLNTIHYTLTNYIENFSFMPIYFR